MKNLYSVVIDFIDAGIKSQASCAWGLCNAMCCYAEIVSQDTVDSIDKANSVDASLETMIEDSALSHESIVRMKSLVWLKRRVITDLDDTSTYDDVMNFIMGTRSHISSMRDCEFHNTFAGRKFDCALDFVDKLSEHIAKKMDSKEDEEYCDEK